MKCPSAFNQANPSSPAAGDLIVISHWLRDVDAGGVRECWSAAGDAHVRVWGHLDQLTLAIGLVGGLVSGLVTLGALKHLSIPSPCALPILSRPRLCTVARQSQACRRSSP